MNSTIKIIVSAVMVMSAIFASAKNTNNASTAPAPAIVPTEANAAVINYKTSIVKDEMGRVVNKIIYKDVDGFWCPLGAYSVYYGEEENVLTYAQWDKSNHRFTLNAQQQHFNNKDYPVLITDSVLK